MCVCLYVCMRTCYDVVLHLHVVLCLRIHRQLNEIWPTGGWGSIEYGAASVPGQVCRAVITSGTCTLRADITIAALGARV